MRLFPSVRPAILLFFVWQPLCAQKTVVWQDLRSEQKYDQAAALYIKGQYARATKLYREACDHFNPKACTDLGFMYESGLGVKRNYLSAAELYRRGCNSGNALGCTNLAHMYWEARLPKSDDSAANFFRTSCDEGDPGGCLNLGFLYENGQGVRKDVSRAAELYRQACDNGRVKACIEFSRLNTPPKAEVRSASSQ